MSKTTGDRVRIAAIADYESGHPSRWSANGALAHAADALGVALEVEWFSTLTLEAGSVRPSLSRFDGIFAPGGDYESEDGVSAAIRFAREAGWPFFGT